jgi:hypothetical protein
MDNTPTEPAADIRVFANFMHQTFIALIAEGFTEQQALVIIGQMMAANSGGKQ